jgi:hypothetical protein
LKNKQLEPMTPAGEEVGTKTLRQEGEEQSSLTQGASHALYEGHPLAQEGLEDGSCLLREISGLHTLGVRLTLKTSNQLTGEQLAHRQAVSFWPHDIICHEPKQILSSGDRLEAPASDFGPEPNRKPGLRLGHKD